jgi:hypothetical protein
MPTPNEFSAAAPNGASALPPASPPLLVDIKAAMALLALGEVAVRELMLAGDGAPPGDVTPGRIPSRVLHGRRKALYADVQTWARLAFEAAS